MNIKELGNYQLINANTTNPVLVGTPEYYTFVYVDKQANNFANDQLPVNTQGDNNLAALEYAYTIIDEYWGEIGNESGAWWYVKDIEMSFLSKDGAPSNFYAAYVIKLFRVVDNNTPATSPSLIPPAEA